MSEKIEYTPIEAKPRHHASRWRKWTHLALLAAPLIYLAHYSQYPSSLYSLLQGSEPIDNPSQVVLDALSINLASKWSKIYTAEAHLAGTNYGLVQWTADQFERYGLKSTIDEYEVLLSYPDDHALNLVAKDGLVAYKAPLKEDVLKEDKTSGGDGLVPTFLGYAANGNVTAQYVYANYATRDDFRQLKAEGVDVSGKIVIARYGAIFRGLKVKFAQDEGAVGVLLYTDPGDDNGITPANGYEQYPKGPARQESSVQRGSVQFLGGLGSAPGDPTTPGYSSKPGAERQDPHDSIGKIPALPISYREVKPILEKLNGHGHKLGKEWKGGLDGVSYSTGPNKEYTLNLYSKQIYNISTIYNVYGEFEGKNPGEAIIVGNHRDAWIKGGAGDPNSGSAVLIEVARALGRLQKLGYKFKRSIILHSYDGEEYGLVGSTEQGEYFAKKYQKDVVAYINLDVAVSGKHLHLLASPLLNHVLLEVAKQVEYPDKEGTTLYDHYLEERGGKIGNLGLGSDYAVYLDHLGIASVDFGFTGGKGDPVYHYHSNYDSYHWISEYADKGFKFHGATAKYLSLLILRLAERDVIDFKLEDYSYALGTYFNTTLEKVPKSWLDEKVSGDALKDFLGHDEKTSALVKEASQGEYSDHSRYPFMELMSVKQCSMHKVVRFEEDDGEFTVRELLNHTLHELISLQNLTTHFDAHAEQLQEQADHWDSLRFWEKIKLFVLLRVSNKLLHYFERNFLHHDGLDGRPWYRHIVYAGGRYTGYAGQTLPGLLEAIEDHDLGRFVHWLGVVDRTLRRINHEIS
ncbi:uncharacterized protein CANTADRAFT_46791 [Suhomyces tanzawaensis NRRL Y-17324]|uniref:Membrane protein n=1 Tax=Suhomyces tanzawaensis NRRL Y-17324 TaxID=984487 RepID=A0A1E4SPG6_9ASCO|nr:uncharacterized protein CANTADRAFT_46791 [Suhomyces tanzawaensis NRRL Y-17324]ODV81282.1 membrane protein [Suhomyces tanzawaensis NRRL Y-17324]